MFALSRVLPASTPPVQHEIDRCALKKRDTPACPVLGAHRSVFWLAAGCLFFSGASGVAQERVTPAILKQMSVEELLSQPVMSVSRRPEPWGEAAGSVFMIRAQSGRLSGATTLPQLLRLAPNLFVAQSSSSQWAVNARGFMRADGVSNKLLVLVDGRSVYSPLFSNVFWDAQDVFLPDVDRVEVMSGPSGATWGTNAVNGVINVLSKSAYDTQGGVFYAEGGTEIKSNLGVRYGAPFGDSGAFRVYAKHAEYDATLSARGVDDGFDAWQSAQAGFRMDWGRPLQTEWTLQGDAFRGDYENGERGDTRSDGANLLLRLVRHVSEDDRITARFYHDYTARTTPGVLSSTTRVNDLELQHQRALDENQEIIWGGNYRLIHDRVRDTVGFTVLPMDEWLDLAGLFFQHQINFAQQAWRLTTGVRLEHNEYTRWEWQPSARLSWFAAPGSTLWLSASRATRTPSRLDTSLYIPAEPPYTLGGAPDFVSERLHAYELGWRARFGPSLVFTAVLYSHEYDDLRSLEPTVPITTANGVEGRSYGGEFFVDWDIRPWWRLRAGYFHTEQETRLRAGGADLERGLGESSFPQHQFLLRHTLQFGPRWTLWAGLRDVGAVPVLQDGALGRVPAYTELDLRLAWNVRSDLELALTGRNLLDKSHPEIGADRTRREIQRSVHASLRWEF